MFAEEYIIERIKQLEKEVKSLKDYVDELEGHLELSEKIKKIGHDYFRYHPYNIAKGGYIDHDSNHVVIQHEVEALCRFFGFEREENEDENSGSENE